MQICNYLRWLSLKNLLEFYTKGATANNIPDNLCISPPYQLKIHYGFKAQHRLTTRIGFN